MTFNAQRIHDIHEELSLAHRIEPGYKDRNNIASVIYKINSRIGEQ